MDSPVNRAAGLAMRVSEMELRLHKNARTTPAVRAYIQKAEASAAELARELGISETTVRKWRGRDTQQDASHRPKRLRISLSPIEEQLVRELRMALGLSLDDIHEVMRRCVNDKLSRSAIYRCLKRNSIATRPRPDRPKAGKFEPVSCGFIHIDVKYLTPLHRKRSYAFVAIDRATRYVYLEILPKRDGETAARFLRRFLGHFPYPVHTILTGNGSEFTDRFAVDKKGKPENKPSGQHPFDKICAEHQIEHRLTRPYKPQTNGMVERFNRRLSEHLNAHPKQGSGHRRFRSASQRNAYIHQFVADYNRTRLRCLDYKSPLQTLNNLTEHNTFAGVTR